MFWKKKKQIEQQPTPKTKIPLTYVYTDKTGLRWFKYENNLELPAKRAIEAEVATRFAEMNLTKSVLSEVIVQMKKHANSGDIVSLFSLIGELEYRLEFIGEEETLLQLAACYFVIEGEDESDFQQSFKRRKMEILQDDPDAKGFFLQKSFELTTKYSTISGTVIQDYLNQNKVDAEKLLHILRQSKSGIMSKR